MNYQSLMGVEDLAKSSNDGYGVKIAILDSGMPKPSFFGRISKLGDCKLDKFGHATAVSSILFGGFGIKGLCINATPYYYPVLDDSGSGSIKSVVRGIEQALDDDVDIINLSLGFSRTEKCPKKLEKACENAYNHGKTVICAAGNDGGPVNWPAALKTTICVGSAAKNGLKTSFSSVGEVDFIAPGENLSVLCPDGRVKEVSGTSYSAAVVTGVSALIVAGRKTISHDRSDVDYVVWSLRNMSVDVDSKGWDEMTGYGVVGGKKTDSTVCMDAELGFFGKILCKLESLFGKKPKENNNGRV